LLAVDVFRPGWTHGAPPHYHVKGACVHLGSRNHIKSADVHLKSRNHRIKSADIDLKSVSAFFLFLSSNGK